MLATSSTDFILFKLCFHVFIDALTNNDRSTRDKIGLYLAIILPVIVVALLVIAFILWFLCRRKQRCVVPVERIIKLLCFIFLEGGALINIVGIIIG